jgi:hypothetical protein
MILRPSETSAESADFISAWEAVARTQKTRATHYYLVRQPDHARLAGRIAGHLAIPGAPAIDDEIVRGISLHDEGWADFDCGRERLQATPACYGDANVAVSPEGKPLSFLDVKAGDFLQAWRGSIESAEAVASIAGLIVSGHFCRIGRFGMSMATYSERDMEQVREFLVGEEQRQRRLMNLSDRSEKELEFWTDVLQFCDLLSLYLCCGSDESVEFGQRIGPKGETLTLQVNDGVNVLSPSPFVREVEFSLEAQRYPPALDLATTKLTWRVR